RVGQQRRGDGHRSGHGEVSARSIGRAGGQDEGKPERRGSAVARRGVVRNALAFRGGGVTVPGPVNESSCFIAGSGSSGALLSNGERPKLPLPAITGSLLD